ncbi:MAG: HAD-IIIA family hydrolase [Gammaproteobacteria bacterium]|nr:HAD-IIIA family hydrolase [Gammaproteobacteria bacterium]MDP6615602.1 HAD-IIIA family hydrolase [Gammaproteobacteria bacterium]MDP6694724.1 HAD-IIIA family hydrolase [Gammaproteobacteria bacterium]
MVYKKVDLDKVRKQAAGVELLVLDVDGVLTDGRLHFDAKGNEFKVFHARDGYGIRRLLEAGVQIAIISGRKSVAVEKRAAELAIPHVHLGAQNKLAVMNKLVERLSLNTGATACVGDDIPDLACMEQAGLAIAVADAHPDLDAVADWHTHNGGGQGAVREVCDLLLAARLGAGN